MRALRIVLIAAVAVGGLFTAADRIALALAESEAADRVQLTHGLPSKPDVSIKGFPFLTQAATGELDAVRVTTGGIEGPLRVDRFSADLHGVRLGDGGTGAVADTLTGSALITYADLTEAAPPGVTVEYGGDGRVKLTGGVEVGGRTLELGSVLSEVSVVGGDTVSLEADVLPPVARLFGLEDLLRRQIDFTRELTGLPEGVSLKSVEPAEQGVEVSMTGTDVVLLAD